MLKKWHDEVAEIISEQASDQVKIKKQNCTAALLPSVRQQLVHPGLSSRRVKVDCRRGGPLLIAAHLHAAAVILLLLPSAALA